MPGEGYPLILLRGFEWLCDSIQTGKSQGEFGTSGGIPRKQEATRSTAQDKAMISFSTPQPRPKGTQVAARLVTVRRVLLSALMFSVQDSGMAWAQHARPTPQSNVDGSNEDPEAKCSLYNKYCPIRFESFLLDANDYEYGSEVGFIRDFTGALAALVCLESGGSLDEETRYQVTRVIAPPGYGKSALLRYLERILQRDERICGSVPQRIASIMPTDGTFEIKNHFCQIKLEALNTNFGIRSTMLDDLKNDGGFPILSFAKLRAFDYDDHAAPGIEYLVKEFTSQAPNLRLDRLILIIDSIDEIHPDSAKSLLTRLDDYIKQRRNEDKGVELGKMGFLRVFVVGRPEGFTDYYRIAQGGVSKTRPVRLKEPCFRSHDDLVCATRSVAQFNILGGEEDPRQRGQIKVLTDNTISFARKHSWLKECFKNLSALGDLIRFSNIYVSGLKSPRSLEDDYELKEVFFQCLLARARSTHNRPTSRSQEYVQLLEEIACKFARGHQVDKEGYFLVTPNDLVEIGVEFGKHTQTASYLVESVLNRSGVVDLDSVDRFPRYRFYPGWVRTHLLERHRRRLKELAEQGNCARPSCCP